MGKYYGCFLQFFFFEIHPEFSDFVNSDNCSGKFTSKSIRILPVFIQKKFWRRCMSKQSSLTTILIYFSYSQILEGNKDTNLNHFTYNSFTEIIYLICIAIELSFYPLIYFQHLNLVSEYAHWFIGLDSQSNAIHWYCLFRWEY